MTYFAILALVVVAALLYQARGVIGVILCDAKMRAGDYPGALRRLRWASLRNPNAVILHKEGLILFQAGRPAEAELAYRKALGLVQSGSSYPPERLHASLGYALIDLARFAEAGKCFNRAIEAGDHSGNSHDGLAELRLTQSVEIEEALAHATQAIEHARRRASGRVPGTHYAIQAWALALLGRAGEARDALAQAEHVPEPNPRTAASLHYRAAMALLAMRQPEDARQHFQTARDLDPHGKYAQRSAPYLVA